MSTCIQGASLPPWLREVALQPLPLTLTARQVKTSPYLIEAIKDDVTLNISHEAIRWRSQLDPQGFLLTAQGMALGQSQSQGTKGQSQAPRWLGRLFKAMQAVAAGDFPALAKDFALTSAAKGQLVARPKAKDMAAAITALKLSFASANQGQAKPLTLNQLTIVAPHETTVLSQLRYQPQHQRSTPKAKTP